MSFGAAALLKLRYIIAKFDVGEMAGGLQSDGMTAAQQLQHEMAKRAVDEFGLDVFYWQRPMGQGR